jgi:hypothetical protein
MSRAAHPKDAVLEILKKLQGSIADVRNTQVDMRRDIRDLKTSAIRILSMIGEMVKAEAPGTQGAAP